MSTLVFSSRDSIPISEESEPDDNDVVIVEECTSSEDDNTLFSEDASPAEFRNVNLNSEKSTQTDMPTVVIQQENETVPFGPHPKFSRKYESSCLRNELQLYNKRRVICSVDLLESFVGDSCRYPGCVAKVSVDTVMTGATAILNWVCVKGHCGKFCTSDKLRGLYVNNLIVGASVLFSGNNFEKAERMFKFANVAFLSRAMFFRYQRVILFPVIKEWWKWMQDLLFTELKNQDVIIAGDGQCDSPGKSAKYLCYFLMDTASRYILHVEIMDKRMTSLSSPRMEIEALKRSLVSITNSVNVSELVTDASSSVIKLMRKF